jgi:MFS family permease
MGSPSHHSLARFLALNRTVGIVLITVLCFGLGEQLWSQFMPSYLDAQTKERARAAAQQGQVGWAVLALVGAYGCARNLLEGVCYIGGGHLTARLGDRGSLLLFGALTVVGYLLFLAVPGAWAAVLAAMLIQGWEPLSVPVTFTTIGSTVDQSRQGMAFAVQSIQKRLPKILGPLLAGFVLGAAGALSGMRILMAVALGLSLASIAIQVRWMPHYPPPPPGPGAFTLLRQLHPTLRRLLIAEVFTRWCDWLVRDFVIFYVMVMLGLPFLAMGALFATQNTVALLTYLPVGRLTQSTGLRRFIGLTFVFFALFPLVLVLVPGTGWSMWLVLAFVVYGLREIGEPARKALITSLFPPEVRARGVGLYWGTRSFAICWAPLVGAAVWQLFGPQALLYAAFGMGCVGTAVFYLFCREPRPIPVSAISTRRTQA